MDQDPDNAKGLNSAKIVGLGRLFRCLEPKRTHKKYKAEKIVLSIAAWGVALPAGPLMKTALSK
jgi:hypothetical protein